MKNNWKKEFDNYFLEKIGKDDGYTEERRIVKDFIESLLADARSESYTNGYRDGYDQQKKELLDLVGKGKYNKNCIRVHPYRPNDPVPLCHYGSCSHILLPEEKFCPCHT